MHVAPGVACTRHPAGVMAPGRAPRLAPVAYRSVLLLWLLSGLVGGFLVGAPRIAQPRGKHAAHSSSVVDQAANRGAAVTTVLPRRARINAVTASPASANDVTPEEQVEYAVRNAAVVYVLYS